MFNNISASGNGVPRKRGVDTPPRYTVHPSSMTDGGKNQGMKMSDLSHVDDGWYAICPITKMECYAHTDRYDRDDGKQAYCAFWDELGYCQVSAFMNAINRISEAVHGGWGKDEDPPHFFVESDSSVSGAISTFMD